LFDDMARVANGALGTLSGLRQDIETMVRERIARVLDEMDLVSRDEFVATEALARKTREENETLHEEVTRLATRVEALERKMATAAAHPEPGPAPDTPVRHPGPPRPLRRESRPRRRR
jgi:BMFP domain-containing protein YqiC